MTATPIALLPGREMSSAAAERVAAALHAVGPVLRPDLTLRDDAPVVLEGPALSVRSAIADAGGERAALCCFGIGSLVGLQVAADHPEQVAALLLTTNLRLGDLAVQSLYRGVLGLLPALTLQRLGVRPADVLGLLDQVRPIDTGRLAARVTVPALVLVGERDIANRRASAALAGALPQGNLRVLPGAATDWPSQRPELAAAALTDFLDSL